MLANRVREYTTTVGTGDITLGGAFEGYVRFTDNFAPGDSVIYVIEDGGNYEIGRGTLQDATTLTRTTVEETLVDGTLTKTGAVAISLSGNARVYSAVSADYLLDPTKDADLIREVTPDAGVTVDGVLLKDGAVTASAGGTFTGDVTVVGTLDVQGTLNTQIGNDVLLGDTIISLNAEIPADATPTMDAGLEVYRGVETNQSFVWDEAADRWRASSGLTVDGDVNFGGTLNVAAGTIEGRFFHRDVVNSDTVLAGGDGGSSGGNIHLYGPSHSTAANDLLFRAGATSLLRWDNSANQWDFQGKDLVNLGETTIGNNIDFPSRLYFSSNRTSVNTQIGTINARWDGTSVAIIDLQTGPDTVNKDDGEIVFFTASGGALSERLRINHDGLFDFKGNDLSGVGDVTLLGDEIQRSVDTANLTLSGGAAFNSGGAIYLYGGSHATLANDIEFRANGTLVGGWNNSSEHWNFLGNDLTGVGPGGISFSAQGNIDVAAGGFLALKQGGVNKLVFDGFDTWNFQGNNVDLGSGMILNTSGAYMASETQVLTVAGGSDFGSGGNILLYGDTHGTNALDIVLRSNTTTRLHWDNSADHWNFQGNDLTGVGKLTVYGGAKISVMNKVDGGSDHGIFLYDSDNTGYGIYMASPGAGKSLGGGTACTPLNGNNGFQTRFRAGNVPSQGFLWENGSEQCLMSLTPDTGDLYTKGNLFCGGSYVAAVNSGMTGQTSVGSVGIAGGAGLSVGGNIVFYAQDHASHGNDIQLRSNTSIRLHWDDSSNRWDFRDNILSGVGDVTMAGTTIQRSVNNSNLILSGGTGVTEGANIVLVGQTHPTQAADMLFRHAGTNILTWDDSASHWNFQGNNIAGVGHFFLSGNTIARNVSNDGLNYSGGNSSTDGMVMTLFGSDASLGSLQNGLRFRAAGSDALTYTRSTNTWDFHGATVVGVGTPVTATNMLDGSAASPGLPFENDLDTGFYHPVANALSIVTGGVEAVRFGSEQNAIFGGRLFTLNGSAAEPVYSFSTDNDTGMYLVGQNFLGWSCGGQVEMSLNSSGILAVNNSVQLGGASASAPAFSFSSDTDTGMYRSAANRVSLAAQGEHRVTFGPSTEITDNTTIGNACWISGGNTLNLVVGGDSTGNTLTDATNKFARIASPHYTNAEQPTAMFVSASRDLNSDLGIGGGSSLMNAVTDIYFYTAANTTTPTGTTRGRIRPDGTWEFYGNDLTGVGDITSTGGVFQRSINTGTTQIFGGSGGLGASLTLYGGAHATQANDIHLRSSATNVLTWDSSATEWNFQGHALTRVGPGNGVALTIGADGTGAAVTDSTQKIGRLASPHYTNAEEPMALLWGNSGASFNHVNIGGGTSFMNTATTLNFYTAINSTTTTGTLRGSINSVGTWDFQGNILQGVPQVRRGASTGTLRVSGGTNENLGGNAVFYGESHATQPNDIELRSGSATVLHYDDSTDTFDFKGKTVTNAVGLGGSTSFAYTSLPDATPSGSVTEVTGIPDTASEVIIRGVGVGTNGGTINFRMGTSSGIETTGYKGGAGVSEDVGSAMSVNTSQSATGLTSVPLDLVGNNDTRFFRIHLSKIGTDSWDIHTTIIETGDGQVGGGMFEKTLAGTLDRIDINCGASSFSGGTLCVAYR